MAISSRKSGLVQRVKPFLGCGLIEVDDYSSSAAATDQAEALKDPNSPKAIPDVPSGEAPYDGLVAWGVMTVDAAGDGP